MVGNEDEGPSQGIDLLAALNALARGQEHLDTRNAQILSRLDAGILVQDQSTERVVHRIDALALPPDSRDELIALRDEVRRQSRIIEALQASPIGRADMDEVIVRKVAGRIDGQMRPAIAAMTEMPAGVRQSVSEINSIVRGARARRAQNRWLAVTAGIALLAGFVLYPLVAATMPGGSHLAAFATGETGRWKAGWSLLKSQNEQARDVLVVMDQLHKDNSDALRACSDAVWAKGKSQPCSLIVNKPLP